jgi:hypothetical protein
VSTIPTVDDALTTAHIRRPSADVASVRRKRRFFSSSVHEIAPAMNNSERAATGTRDRDKLGWRELYAIAPWLADGQEVSRRGPVEYDPDD